MKRVAFALVILLLAARVSMAGVTFSVRLKPEVSAEPASGRLVVALVPTGPGKAIRSPLEAPFWEDPVPMFGVDVRDLKPGSAAVVDDSADYSTIKLADVPPGEYLAAVWIISNRATSSWKNDPGNISGTPTRVTIDPAKPEPVALTLTKHTNAPELPTAEGVEWFSERSTLLSDFHGRDVMLKAGVVLPAEYDPKKTYGVVYWIPGFGGDQTEALRYGRAWRNAPAGTPEGDLARRAFLIVLDPESPNGHTLFADSDNNGPCANALVTELIPALEAKYPLIAKPEARLLRGHSSGGWSSIWLAINHPETFGKAWASSPDPVDFEHFQRTDIYAAPNMYFSVHTLDPHTTRQWDNQPGVVFGKPIHTEHPSYRRGGQALMTVREENGGERVLGANQTSGQQWASWQAVFGPRVGEQGWGRGHPAALYDSVTGTMDRNVAEQFKRADITSQLLRNPERYGPLLRDRVRIVVGEQDNFYLNEAVASLQRQLIALGFHTEGDGRITIVPEADHGTVIGSAEIRGFPREMLKALDAAESAVKPQR